jgi:hypothetical protein
MSPVYRLVSCERGPENFSGGRALYSELLKSPLLGSPET